MTGTSGNPGRQKAIVIGASMAGLLATRALADHFENVALIERDPFPPPGANRKGVPQGRHTHVLLERGHQILEAYLPGLTEELTQLGAILVKDVSANVRWFHSGGYHQPGKSGFSSLAVSRPTLEGAVRRRLLALPNVTALEGCSVIGLATTPSNDCVTGVRLASCEAGDIEERLLADLVVDASGRGSRTPAWLEELGYPPPLMEEVRIGMGYVSCYYRRCPEHIPGLEGIVLMATPPDRRIGILLAQDDNRWVLMVGGYMGDHPPTDPAGFLEAVSRLPTSEIYQVVKEAEPLGAPVRHTFPANLRCRYDKLTSFPKNYLVIGDALCSFNPIYGQRMTVAALEALTLGECLSQEGDSLAKLFFSRTGKIIDASWDAAVGTDLGFSEVEGPRTPMIRFFNWYLDKLHAAALTDAEVSIAFLRVINMVAPPPSLMHPRIVSRVLRANLHSNRQQQIAGFSSRTR